MLTIKLARFKNGHDAWMIEPRRSLGLVMKAAHFVGVGELAREDHFDGHRAVQPRLTRLIDDTHPAAADFLDQFIIAEDSRQAVARVGQAPREERHGRQHRRDQDTCRRLGVPHAARISAALNKLAAAGTYMLVSRHQADGR
jgi:hypothetical protein